MTLTTVPRKEKEVHIVKLCQYNILKLSIAKKLNGFKGTLIFLSFIKQVKSAASKAKNLAKKQKGSEKMIVTQTRNSTPSQNLSPFNLKDEKAKVGKSSKLNKAMKTIQALQKYAKTSAYQTLT